MYRLSFLTVIIISFSLSSACDSALEPENFDEQQPFFRNLQVNPSEFSFDPQTDGQKDTTIALNLSVEGFNFETDSVPYYSVFVDGEDLPSYQGDFPVNFSPNTTFSTQIEISTNTIEFHTYTVLVTPSETGNNSNYATAVIDQTGVPINPPEILEVNNPDTLIRPESGSITAFFTAKITDPDGQSNIEEVLIRIFDREIGQVQGSPFEMFDDGITYEDETANDSVFTFSLPVTQTNDRPNRDFDIEYYGIDKSGLSTDTLKTIFIIREQQ